MSTETEMFERIVKESGVPTSEDAIKAVFKQEVEAAGSTINNDSRYSPFWRAISALITRPTLWLVQELLIKRLMPQFFLKTVTGEWLTLWADNYNLTLNTGQPTQGWLSFERESADEAITLPAGYAIKTLPINGHVYEVRLLNDLVFEIGEHNHRALCQAPENGAAYNLEAGYYTQIETPGLYVNHGTDWITQPGVDDETEANFKARIRNQFNSLSDYHIDGVYRRLISEFAGVPVGNVFFLHDAPRGPGTANAYVLFDLAAPSDSVLKTINRKIMDDGHHGHGDDLVVYLMPKKPVDVVATVYLKRELIEFERNRLMYEVEQAIRAAFRQNLAYNVTRVNAMSRFSFARLTGELVRLFPELNSVEFDQREIISELSVPALQTLTMQEAPY